MSGDKYQSNQEEEDSELWKAGSFIESVSADDVEKRGKTIHKKHDEDMNYNCKKCNKKISAHNKDWHDNMCDECFDKTYFPDD